MGSGGQTTLNASQARAFYDRFGERQDTQGVYESRALDDLVAHATFGEAQSVFELGFGTGRLAVRLLAEELPPAATYSGLDVSQTMVELAARRIALFADRASVARSDGAMRFPPGDQSVDRVVSAYVLDLLSRDDTSAFFAEAHRVLAPGGKLCLVGLTDGISVSSRIVATVWTTVFRLRPSLVGGCRPVRLGAYVDPGRWLTEYHRVVTQLGVPSEVLILGRRAASGGTGRSA